MEVLYCILALVLTVISNIYCTTVIADRYNIRNTITRHNESSPNRSIFIWLTSVLAFALCCAAMIIMTAPNSDGVYSNSFIGLSFDFLAASGVMLTWLTGLISFHSIRGFIRNFRKFLPRISVSTNKFFDNVIGLKGILFRRAKTRVVAELHKDEEIKRLTDQIHEFKELLRISNTNRPDLTLAPVEPLEPSKKLPVPVTRAQ